MRNNLVYSFDVFDTVLVRKWARPTDLFLELGSILLKTGLVDISSDEWQKLRVSSEIKARSKTISGEVDLLQIYEVIAESLGWSSTEIEYSMNEEIELEFASLYPIREIQQKIQNLHQDGHRIIFISDMYLPSDVIKRFLKHHQIWHERDRIYVSSEFNANKSSGKLFEICLAKEEIKPSQLIHLGDNYHSDVKMPQTHGIQSKHFHKTQFNRYEQIIVNSEDIPLQLRSLLAGTSRLCRLQNPESDVHSQVIWDTSVNVTAPLLFGFVFWCLSEAQEKGIKRLYFIARDGQILLKIAKVICEKWNYTIDCRYLYGSRQAWHFPAITEIGETELDWIFDPTQFLSVNSVCERVNLNPEQIATTLKQNGFSKEFWAGNLDVQKRSLLRDVFQKQEVTQVIIDMAKTYREKAIGYFRQEGLADDIHFGIVDIGWHGRLQRSFSKLLNIAGFYPCNGIYGFYFGLSKRVKLFPKECLFAYFSDVDFPSERDKYCHRVLLELFVSADHGGTLRFEEEKGKFIPILRNKENKKDLKWGLNVQQSAIVTYAHHITNILKDNKFKSKDLLEGSEKLLKEFVNNPNLDEANVFGSWIFAEDQTDNIVYYLAPKYTLKECLDLNIKGRHPHHNIWFPASYKRTDPVLVLLIHPTTLRISWKVKSLTNKIKKLL